MALLLTDYGIRRKQIPVSGEAGGVVCERFELTLTPALAASITSAEIIELAGLPARHTIVDATLDTDELGAVTVSAGLISGEFGKKDDARTMGTELFNGAADASIVRMSLQTGFRIAPSDLDRGIGLKFSGTVTPAGQKVALILFTKQ